MVMRHTRSNTPHTHLKLGKFYKAHIQKELNNKKTLLLRVFPRSIHCIFSWIFLLKATQSKVAFQYGAITVFKSDTFYI